MWLLKQRLEALSSVRPPKDRVWVRYAHGTSARAGAGMSDDEGAKLGQGSAADLLSKWRAAERDRVAAEDSAGVASLAKAAADEAALAATETAEAARLSLEAAQRAELAARRTSEAASLASRTASRESQSADAALVDARSAEDSARTAFHDAQDRGFPKG